MGPNSLDTPVHTAPNPVDTPCIYSLFSCISFFIVFLVYTKITYLYSNIQPIVGRVSRTGIPDRFCLFAISRKFFTQHLPKINYLIQGNELQSFE